MTKLLALVDGEHYPAAVRLAIDAIRMGGRDVVGALFCGGSEKVDLDSLDDAYGVPVVRSSEDDNLAALVEAIERFAPDAVLDMTDEPVLSSDERFALASIALSCGVAYGGADFELRPPRLEQILTKPSISVFATGKRTGKTAVASALARHAAARGHTPVIVAVGRGGPDPPRTIEAGTALTSEVLVELADAGQHASSDYVEDAVTSGVTTIGCVRVGGGLAGATVFSNMAAGARMAQERPEDLVILEGSGSAIPEVAAGAGIICVPATLSPRDIASYLNPYRLLLADLAVVTMAEEGSSAATAAAAIRDVGGIRPELDVVFVVFRPEPLADVRGRKAFFCTTAPKDSGTVLKEHLEQTHGCEVVGMTHRLSDRRALRDELSHAPTHDVMLVELKAAAVDVAARAASKRSTEVVFVNNALVGMGSTGVEDAFDHVLGKATERSKA
jgi:cyclic 2,3-diphosphoglycerate synthetase